jgi:DNA-binding response OmpR family regulator
VYIVKILYVEDNEKLARLTAENLRLSGHIVELVHDLETSLHYTRVDRYEVIILDRMLPGGQDGLLLCAELRKRGDTTPVIVLTALGNVDHRVLGFKNGADDYLTKPFNFSELLMRIKAVTRRASQTPATVIIGENITINLPMREVFYKGERINLSQRLWSLLEYFLLHQNQTTSKERLIDRVWGVDSGVLENTVEVAVKKLRVKLHDEKGRLIQTVHGFGYRLVA